ncbi:MAG: DUF2764 family protein [Pseudomonadota bacterium]
MSDSDAYITLVSSLPASERLFVAKKPPLSRVRLERRLTLLSAEDRETLAQIESIMSWGAYSMNDTEADVLARVRAVMAGLKRKTLRTIVAERMDLRTTIAALRMRRRGDGPPTALLGASRLVPHIIANWSDPAFHLQRRLPWLREAVTLLEKDDPLALERHLLDTTFRQLKRHAARHSFDFEAVVIYVLKWSIFDRWADRDTRAAERRFETLTQQALKGFDGLVLEGAL